MIPISSISPIFIPPIVTGVLMVMSFQIKISPPYSISMEGIDTVLDVTYQAITEVQEQVL